ncbi:MAG: NADH-quinone oxidoreductase subunit NuoF [Deltaproteobacteria bacterium]|nr:NADH-quinone oxidoreductase subunit NuoF [Deltaproteobacteria bacterium]
MKRYLTRNFDHPDAKTIAGYEKTGGYLAARKALQMRREEILGVVKESNLHGRGGAGFPVALKWSFLPANGRPRVLVVNGDEGEPGTFKDRQLMEQDPHQLLEGILIAAYAIQAHKVYIYIRGELGAAARMMENAIEEARRKGYIGPSCFGVDHPPEVIVRRGAGAYICGEETALLESLEGRQGFPRIRPPFPALVGAFGQPTIIHNVETLCALGHILRMGGQAYAALGTEREGGTRIFGVSGHVEKPGLYELPIGFNFGKLIHEVAGGVRRGKKLKAVFPGGSSTPVLLPSELDCPLSIEGVKKAGSAIGSGAVIAMDQTTCMVQVAWRLAGFYQHESCGQCVPCRIGTKRLLEILTRITRGHGQEGDLGLLREMGQVLQDSSRCGLGQTCPNAALSTLSKFRGEYEAHIREKRCPASACEALSPRRGKSRSGRV